MGRAEVIPLCKRGGHSNCDPAFFCTRPWDNTLKKNSLTKNSSYRPPFSKGEHRGILLALCVSLLLLLLSNNSWGQGVFIDDPTSCTIGFDDFIAFAGTFNSKVGGEKFNPIMDLNDDGFISFPDFIAFASSFGKVAVGPATKKLQDDSIRIEARATQIISGNAEVILSFSERIRITSPENLLIKTLFKNMETGDIEERNLDLLQIVLSEDRMNFTAIAKGVFADSSTFSVSSACLKGDIWLFNAYQPVTGEAIFSSPYSPADVTLSLRPFSPTDMNPFTPGVYTEASEMVPASGDTLTEETARVALEGFLAKRYVSADSVQLALSVFDDAILVSKISNPTLRAGLVSVRGTMAADAITAIQRGPFGPIAFGEVTSGDYAEVRSGGVVVVDERYRSEVFALFGPVFARVALQSDTSTGEAEEITGSAILALVAMEQALVDSTIAQSGSELSRRLNTQMYGRLNSGKAGFPGIGIYQTPEGEAFPGGRSFASYAAVFEPLDDVTTPATSLLGNYLERLAPEGTELPNAGTFNTDVLDFLDRHQNVISSDDLIRVARILKLKN